MNEHPISNRLRRYFAGATVEQALVLAARHHGIDPAEIAFRQLEKRHGFVKVPRRVILEVDPNHPRRLLSPGQSAPAQPRREPRAAAPERPRPSPPARTAVSPPRPEQSPLPSPTESSGQTVGGDPLAAAREAVLRVLRFARLELSAEVRFESEELRVELSGPDRSLLLEDEAEVLLAIEHLVPRTMGRVDRDSLVCRVDSGGFRSGRDLELQQLASAAAAQVRSTGRAVRLEPLSPSERRVVHMTLADAPDVATESEGDGHFKQVVVRPV